MDDLRNRFTYHPPITDQVERYLAIRRFGYEFAQLVDGLCPDGREKSIAITRIEEAVMWTNAGIARNEPG